MSYFQTLVALSSLALVTGCATATGPGKAAEHASHHPAGAASAPASPVPDRMKAMRDMHDKMMNAKTPEEKQALMAEHMKAMHGGMQMMKGMGAKGRPDDMAQRQKMMEERMDTMQMMMDMMMQRMPASGVPPAPK